MASKSKKPVKAAKKTAAKSAKPAAKVVKASIVKPNKGDPQASGAAASRLIDQRIKDIGGWRGEVMSRMRALILEAAPGAIEEWKWGIPVWSHAGIICTGETYKTIVKLTFAKGASIEDPSRLFNASLDGNVRRAIDIHEGDKIDGKALKSLIRAAVALNTTA